jgi:ATP-dependent helicase/nuclease subunit A
MNDRLLYELPTNLVVAAGAGTGKTHRLAGLYLHLVAGLTDVGDAPIGPQHIVATTFTREAAAEMRSRIEHRLRALSERSISELAGSTGDAAVWASELLATCMRRNVDPPPRAVFRRALELLPRGAITTFHAWAGELVRAHPIEAGVAPGFSLLDPEDADALMASATRDVVNDWLASDEHVVAARALLHSGFDLLAQHIRTALMRSAEEGTNPSALYIVDSEEAAACARDDRRELLASLGRAAELCPPKKDVASLVHAARSYAESFALSGNTEHALSFGGAVKDLHAALPPGSEARAVLAPSLQRDGRGTITDQAIDILTAPERTHAASRLARSARQLLVEISRALTAAKRRMRALDFGDILRAARDLLRDHPDVQASVVRDVRALLVDEFQDTNVLQRDLVYLARQAPEHIGSRKPGQLPATNTLSRTGLFLVGDRKQSIYAFRGADVAVFQQIALDLAGDEARELLGGEGQGGGHGKIVSLAENRRSVDEILAFVNALSARDMRGHDALSPIEQVVFNPELESLRAVRSSSGEGARVVVARVEPPAGTRGNEISADLLAALAVAGELRDLIAAGTVRARDCAILIRTYAPLPAIEFALSLHGVEYAVSAGRGLFATPEAGDVAALAQLLLDPRDRHALLAVLRGPFVALTDRSLLLLAGPMGLGLEGIDRLEGDERRRVDALLAVLENHRLHGARLGAAAALRRAIDALRYEDTLSLLPSGSARVRDLRRILEHAERFDTGLSSFADWLSRGREGELDEARGAIFDESRDAVRIMTIHGSKGLEFGTVFVMQIEHGGPNSMQGPLVCARSEAGLSLATRVEVGGVRDLGLCGRALAERALAADRAERQRLTYVALTRARDRLYLVARPGVSISKHSAAFSIVPLLEAQPHLAETKPLPVRFDPAPAASRAPIVATERAPFVVGGAGSVVVTTALSDFATCARRFRLLHVVGLPEHAPRARPLGVVDVDDDDEELDLEVDPEDESLPVGPLPSDPRAQGVLAHLALERAPLAAAGEGAAEYAASFLRGEGYDPTDPVGARVAARIVRFLRSSYAQSLSDARVERERAFIVPLPSGVQLRGTIDLVVVRTLPDRTRVEIVDYKSGPEKDIARYALQLRAYAAACARGALGPLSGRVEIVAGVAFLGGGSGEPHWLPGDPGSEQSIEEIDAIARRLLRARLHEEWPGIEAKHCVAIRCGFYPFCHPQRDAQREAPP